MSYFACGGYYPTKKDGITTYEFKFVKPSSSELPYITQKCKENLFNLCKHHSHLYELTVGNASLSAKISYPSYEADIGGVLPLMSPGEIEIPTNELNNAMFVILSEKFWEV
jgi:hypothetical protein